MQHIDKLEAPLREWIRVLMLPPEQIEGTAELKRRRIDSYMTEKQRRVLRLFYGYNLTMKELSALLGVKYKAVDMALCNARKRLRKLEAGGDRVRQPAFQDEAAPAGPRSCKTCAYSVKNENCGLICNYAELAGRTRLAQDAKKENGSCRLWAGKTAETTALVRALRSAKLGSVPAGERGLED